MFTSSTLASMERRLTSQGRTETSRPLPVCFGRGDQTNGAIEALRGADVDGAHVANAVSGNAGHVEASAESHAGEDAELVARVLTVDVEGGIGFGVSGLLRLGERLVEVDAAGFHLGEDVVGGAVEDAVQGAQAVSGGGFLDDAQDRNAAGDTGFEADGQVAGDGEGEEFVAVLGEELLVGGDDGLAVLEGSAKKLQGVVDAAHGLDDDVNVVGGEKLLPSGGDAGAVGTSSGLIG